MKKFCKFLIAFILCFIFVGKAEARYSAIYTNEFFRNKDAGEPLVRFMVYSDGDGFIIRPMNDFTYKKQDNTTEDTWDDDDALVVKGDTSTKVKFASTVDNYKSKRYLYYDIRNGRDNFYFSDSINVKAWDYDMKFERIEPSVISGENAIINEINCVYGPGDGQTDAEYSFVTFNLKREGSVVKYNIYIDHKKFFPEDVVLTHSYTGSNGLSVYETKYKKYIYKGNSLKGTLESKYYDIITRRTMLDHVNPNNFWNMGTGVYKCPKKASIGIVSTSIESPGYIWENGERSLTQNIEIAWDDQQFIHEYDENITYGSDFLYFWEIPIGEKVSAVRNLSLYEGASYIDYEKGTSSASKVCLYYKTSKEYEESGKPDSDVWNFALQEMPSFDGRRQYIFYEQDGNTTKNYNNVYFNIPSGKIDETCLDYVYTNCLNGDRTGSYYTSGVYVPGYGGAMRLNISTCVVSETQFGGSEKIATNEYLNEQDNAWVEDLIGEETGYRYRQYICDLESKLRELTTEDKLSQTSLLKIYDHNSEYAGDYNILNLPCRVWTTESDFTCTTEECKNDIYYSVTSQTRKILFYCEDVYKGLLDKDSNADINKTLLMGRHYECDSFKTFYKSLISNGIIQNQLEGCGILSGDFKAKLNWILNILKIAGPIIAVVLGMLDFTKVIVGEDADKEMKSAWKRFKTRLIAAALLFIFPMLLSILINMFIGDKIGYNPYCDLFEEKPIETARIDSWNYTL